MTRSISQQRQASASGVRQSVVAPLMLGALLLLGAGYLWDLHVETKEHGNSNLELLRPWDRIVLDWYHRIGHKTPARDDTVVVGIDSQSLILDDLFEDDLKKYPTLKLMKHPWPWPRRVWAETIDKLIGAGAKVVFLDLVFKAPSEDPEDDRLLREAIERHPGKVVLGTQFFSETVNGDQRTELMYPIVIDQKTAASDSVGFFNFWTDSDGVIRRVYFQMRPTQAENLFNPGETPGHPLPGEVSTPSVALALAMHLDRGIASRAQEASLLRFCDASAFEPKSIHEIFLPTMWADNFSNGAVFRDKIVLIGATSPEMQDFQKVPVSTLPIEGVRVHAHALSALMASSFLQRAPLYGWELGSLVLGAFLAWLLVSFVKQPVISVSTMWLLTAGIVYGSFWIFEHWNVEASPLPASYALNFCGVLGLTGNFFVQLREKQKLHRFLGRYTSPEVANEMLRDRAGLFTTLSGVEKVVTVFFSDVRGFTSMSEKMAPTEIVGQLNEYLSRMVACVFTHRGVVDKFVGDAVMALWGSEHFHPTVETQREDARNAVSGALAMRDELAKLNAAWSLRGIQPFKFGMGIHQGSVVVGNIGSEAPYEKMDFTVIGDSVNLASRIESATKQYGVDLMISEDVHQYVREAFLCRSADLVRVPGKLKPVMIFSVIGPIPKVPLPGLEEFENGVELYREGRFVEALQAFQGAAQAGLDDMLTREVYIKRCKEYISSPPDEWDGVYISTKK